MKKTDQLPGDVPESKKMTPGELVKLRIHNPECPITDEDISNLKVGSAAEEETKIQEEVNKRLAELKRPGGRDTLDSYDILSNS